MNARECYNGHAVSPGSLYRGMCRECRKENGDLATARRVLTKLYGRKRALELVPLKGRGGMRPQR